jgi:anti-sigma B factor antagonist
VKFSIERHDDIVVIALKASLEGGPDTYQIRDDLKARLGEGDRCFILDMKDAGFVNSTGIGVVVSLLSSVKSAGGTLKVCGVSERARRAFVTTGVLQLFDVFDNQEAAIKAFDPAS